jgi:hypothetical protein
MITMVEERRRTGGKRIIRTGKYRIRSQCSKPCRNKNREHCDDDRKRKMIEKASYDEFVEVAGMNAWIVMTNS